MASAYSVDRYLCFSWLLSKSLFNKISSAANNQYCITIFEDGGAHHQVYSNWLSLGLWLILFLLNFTTGTFIQTAREFCCSLPPYTWGSFPFGPAKILQLQLINFNLNIKVPWEENSAEGLSQEFAFLWHCFASELLIEIDVHISQCPLFIADFFLSR